MDQGERARGDGRAGMSVATRETPARARRALAAGRSGLDRARRRSRCWRSPRCSTSGARRPSTSTSGTGSRAAAPGTRRRCSTPHNEHLSLVPVLVYKLLFSTVGTDSYVPYRVAGLLLHCGVAALLFAYARRRVGELLALGAAAIVLFLGTAWPDVLWPFQIGFLGSLAAGIGALLALDREDTPRRRDRRGAARRRAGVVLARAAAAGGGRARGARTPRPALALVDRRRAGRALRGLVRRLRRRGRRRPRTTCSARPATSPRRPRAPRARCSRSTSDWGRTLAVAGVVALLASLHRRGAASWRLLALIALAARVLGADRGSPAASSASRPRRATSIPASSSCC